MASLRKIHEHWEQQAEKLPNDPRSTIRDHNFRRLEIDAILRHLPPGGRILDLGSGDAYSTIEFVRRRRSQAVCVDISRRMLENAHRRIRRAWGPRSPIQLVQGDVMWLGFPDRVFDVVVSERCLINLNTWERQRQALQEIRRVLKPGGLLLMSEATVQGLANLNKVRRRAGLDPIRVVWHNLFFDEARLMRSLEPDYDVEVVNFSSTYMLISRVVHPKIMKPDYDAKINQAATLLPALGDYGYLKLFVCRKKRRARGRVPGSISSES